jgi:histone H3/H4
MDHSRSKTLYVSHVNLVLKNIYLSENICEEKDDLLSSLSSLCFSVPKASFKKLFNNIAREHRRQLRYSKDALILLQLACEDYVIEAITRSILNACHSKSTTLQPSDLQLVRKSKAYINIFKDNTIEYKLETLFKQIYPDKSLNEEVSRYINMVLNRLGQFIMLKSNDLVVIKRNSTVDERTIQNSIRLVMTEKLAKYSIITGIKATTKYITKNDSGFLVFSIPDTRKLMENYTRCRIAKESIIYMTAVLEYIAAELCEISGGVQENLKRVENDEDLLALLDTLGINL